MTRFHGFLIPAAATAVTDSFVQQLAIVAVSGLLGVVGVSLAAYISSRRKDRGK